MSHFARKFFLIKAIRGPGSGRGAEPAFFFCILV
jgi:hypothetical protein